jgi:hypothetical protein
MFASRFAPLRLILAAALLAGCSRPTPPAKPKKETAQENAYTFGQIIRFGLGGEAERYKRGGWGDTEQAWTWTNGQSAALAFRLPEGPPQPLRLRMKIAAYIDPPWLPYQPVEVIVNNEKVADWRVADTAEHFAIIPPDAGDHEQLLVELRTPQATAPAALRMSDDSRTLGLCAFEAAIEPADEATFRRAAEEHKRQAANARGIGYEFGTLIGFGAGGGSHRYKVSGWHGAEKDCTWTSRDPAVLEFAMPPAHGALLLKMRASAMTDETLPVQPVEVRANGDVVAEWQVTEPGEFEATIPPTTVAKAPKLRLELRALKAAAPEELGRGSEKRVLGLRCETLMITETAPRA